MSLLTWLLRSFLKTSNMGQTIGFLQKSSNASLPLSPTPKPSLCCCSLNPFILSRWPVMGHQTKALSVSPMEMWKGTLLEWRNANLDPVSSKCLLSGSWAFGTPREPPKHPPACMWSKSHPCETGCRTKTKPWSYDWEKQGDQKYSKIFRW